MKSIAPFHLAIPVWNLEACRVFYRDILNCEEGRSSDHWVDFNFFGHQLVIHYKPKDNAESHTNPVDGKNVPVPHFGVVLSMIQWVDFKERLESKKIKFVVEPHIRFLNLPGEQATMFFLDPSNNALEIKAGRHPVIEKSLPLGEAYVPNDVVVNNDSQQIIIITGPNMSGKSALLRQTALIVLMAQMGSFVPATSAKIGLVDKIYTRVGASDNISQGESTFMVEMVETASILNNLSDRSLVILDEIGRGTSTFDGVSLAWSIAEFLNQDDTKPKTIFATHYHELNELESSFPGVVNYYVSTEEKQKKVIFLRKMKKGGSEHSFGIHVARMAGIPNKVLKRADIILKQLESDRESISTKESIKKAKDTNYQLKLFQVTDPKSAEIIQTLDHINIESLTPIEALMKLNELKQLLEN